MMKIGTDIVEIERVKHSMQNLRFITRVFSHDEIELFEQKKWNPQTIAANFAAKEAFSKAVGTGIRGFALSEIAVLRDELGAPYFRFYGKAMNIAEHSGLQFKVSLSHCKEYAIAFVVGIGEQQLL